MAYNTNTRLLLKFGESTGSTAANDTSSYARLATITGGEVSSAAGVFSTNSVVLGDPFGSGSAGDVTVNNVSSLFSTSSNSLKRVDLWFRPEAYPPWGNSPLFSITFQNGDTLVVWYSATALEVEYNGTATDPAHYLYQSVAFYPTQSQWYHLRFATNGDTLKMGLDGAETHSITHTADVWTGVSGNPITELRIGCWPSVYNSDANSFLRGYIDAVEFLDGDTSWFGGSYTVPSAEPDDYSGGGPVELFGTGLTTVDDTASDGSGSVVSGLTAVGDTVVEDTTSECHASLGEISVGAGENTADDFSSDGYGELTPISFLYGVNTVDDIVSEGVAEVLAVREAVSENTVESCLAEGVADVTSPNVAQGGNTLDAITTQSLGGTSDDIYTTLSLNGAVANGKIWDSSIYRHDVSAGGAVSSGLPAFQGQCIQFLSTTPAYVTQPSTALSTTSDKRFEFFYRNNSTTDGTAPIFLITFEDGSSVAALHVFGELAIEVITPTIEVLIYSGLTTLPSGTSRHISLAFINDKVHIGVDGVEKAVRTGSGRVWPSSRVSMFRLSSASYTNSFLLDAFNLREGNIGFSGGNYTVPTSEWQPTNKYADGANTVGGVTSSGTALLDKELSGANVVADVTSTGFCVTANIGTGVVTLDNCETYSYGSAIGTPLFGANSVDSVTGSGYLLVLDPLVASGSAGVEPVVSTATANLSWSARGENTVTVASQGDGNTYLAASGNTVLDSVTSVATVTKSRVGYGLSVTDVVSSGVASAVVSGYGTSSVQVVTSRGASELGVIHFGSGDSTAWVESAGTALRSKSLFGANTVVVESSGQADVGSIATGRNTTSVTSTGAGVLERFGAGGNITSVVSCGTGVVFGYAAGYGSSTVSVSSYGAGGVRVAGVGSTILSDVLTSHGVFGYGANTLDEVTSLRQRPPDAGTIFVLAEVQKNFALVGRGRTLVCR